MFRLIFFKSTVRFFPLLTVWLNLFGVSRFALSLSVIVALSDCLPVDLHFKNLESWRCLSVRIAPDEWEVETVFLVCGEMTSGSLLNLYLEPKWNRRIRKPALFVRKKTKPEASIQNQWARIPSAICLSTFLSVFMFQMDWQTDSKKATYKKLFYWTQIFLYPEFL